MFTRIKICCISSEKEAKTAIDAGASALGLVGPMPSGPGIIDDELIRNISLLAPPAVSTFLLTSQTTAEGIINHHYRTFTNTIQLVDSIKFDDYRIIKEKLPSVKIVQVIHVQDESSVEEAIKVSASSDALLLDSGNPFLSVKLLGGTGKTHNWKISRKIVESVNKPVFLAGGLHAGNVRQAIEEVQPFGVDICSGIRTNGNLDRAKLENFMQAVSKAS
jgi:phosphoribosylanthranilate isomerase